MVVLDVHAQTNNVHEAPGTKRWDSELLDMFGQPYNQYDYGGQKPPFCYSSKIKPK